MKNIMFVLVVALTFQFSSAIADSSNEFIVSGVLRSNMDGIDLKPVQGENSAPSAKEDGIVIKLVQGVRSALSATDAVGAFTRDVSIQYPGYSLIDVIASPLPIKVKPCQSFIDI